MKPTMLRIIALLLFISFQNSAFAQDTAVYWIQLKYKGTSSFRLDNASTYLSSKSILRRTRQNIAIDSSDLPVNPTYINQIKNLGVQVLRSSKWLNGVVISSPDSIAVAAINQLPYVKSKAKIQPKKLKRNTTRDTTNFVNYANEKLTYNYGQGQSQVQQIKLDCLHELGYTGKGMTIAILDGGFRNVDILDAFDSLRANNHIKGTYDFVEMDEMVYDWTSDHGTMVLSCMAANLPNRLIGTAPDADYWLMRTEQGGSEYIIEEYNWACGAEMADSVGADLINSSLGYTTYDDATTSHAYLDMNGDICPSSRAADYAASKGILVVNSAGNSGNNSWQYIGAPADADSILSVGAVDVNGTITNFSSIGPAADGAIKPNACARGSKAAVIMPGTGAIGQADGTSFSSPILCGAVACLWQSLPNKNNIEIIRIVEQNAHLALTPDSKYGYGIADLCKAHYSQQTFSNAILQNTGIPQLIPNPFNNTFSIIYNAPASAEVKIKIYDSKARLLTTKTNNVQQNYYYNFEINELEQNASGTYFIDFSTHDTRYTLKAIKQ